MNDEFDKYLGIANHDIQMANTNQELKSYVASILYDNDEKVKEIERLSKEVTKYDEILCERNNEVDRLNNIINELEKYCEENSKLDHGSYDRYGDVLDKLKELKGDNKDD